MSSGSQRFKADCAPIYEPLLGQALLDPEPETVSVVHRVFIQILERLLDKHLTPEQAAEAREQMDSLRNFLEYLKTVEDHSVIFPRAVASLRQWLFREELDPALKGQDLEEFGFLWLEPLETAAFCSHLVRRIAATDEAAGERIHNLAPDAKIKLLLEMAKFLRHDLCPRGVGRLRGRIPGRAGHCSRGWRCRRASPYGRVVSIEIRP